MSSLQCPRCGSGNVININLTIETGPVAFYSCHECDKRWWNDDDGNVIELPELLHRARRSRPAPANPPA